MTRVEAVARAIYAAGRDEFGIRPDHPSPRARAIFERVWSSGGTNDDQREDIKLCYMQAQAAIEANDAWLWDEGYRICAIDPANTPLTQEFVDRLYSKSKPQ